MKYHFCLHMILKTISMIRYFYEKQIEKLLKGNIELNDDKLGMVFFSDQLNEIKKSSLSKIMCENLDIQYIQKDPFSFVSEK